MHEFEIFRRDLAGSRIEPLVTIQRRGMISLNAAAYQALGSPVAVELLFNAAKRVVGLRAVDPHVNHSYILRSSTRSGSGSFVISATAFTRYYEIDTSTALRRVGYLDDDMLCIELDSDAAPAAGRRGHDAHDSDDGDEPTRAEHSG